MRNCILSYEPADKLQALLASGPASADRHLPAKYLDACRLWYDDLAEVDRLLAQKARAAFVAGDGELAAELAMKLPASPPAPEEF